MLRHNYIGTEHILLGLIREGEGVASEVLQGLGVDLARGRQAVVQLLSGYVSEVEAAGAEEVGAYVEVTAAPVEAIGDDAPTCPNCFASLDETLAVKMLATTADDEPFSVKIAYCKRCGVALGAVT